MWQENPQRRPRSPHQCQIRRLYKAIEAIETPHLGTIRNRSPRSPGSDRCRGTLGGCEPIMVLEEKQFREPVHEEKEVDSPVPEKAARILGYCDEGVQRSRAMKNRSEARPRKARRGSWEFGRTLYDTPPDTPILRELFELEGDHSPLLIDTTTQYIAELPGSPVFSSVSWSGEDKHELPATPATPTESWDQSLMPHPLRLRKSSICIKTGRQPSHNPETDGGDACAAEDTAELSLNSRRSSKIIRYSQPRPMTICAPQSTPPTTSSQSRSQGLHKVKARHDLRIPTPNTHQAEVPLIAVTNPALEMSRQRSARAEKANEAGFFLSPVIGDVPKEERKWEEITEAADLEICMAVLAKEIARRRTEMRS